MGFSLSSLDPTKSGSITNTALGGTVGGAAGDFIEGSLLGGDAARASREAAGMTADAQQQMFEYFQEMEAIPQELRQGSLQQLGGLYGIPGFEEFGNQQQMIDQAQASPFFKAGMDTGTESVARHANVTGGLRGGGGAADIAGFQSNLLNQAYNQQVQGVQGLAQLPSTSLQSAQLMGAPAMTTAQGMLAGQQAKTDAFGNIMNLGGQMGQAAIMSDQRLKDNIEKTGTTSHPKLFTYKWDWKSESGNTGSEEGFLAQEVEKVWPEFVITGSDGIKRIYKDKIEDRLKELN